MLKISKIIILGFLLLLYQLGFSQAAVFQKIPGTAIYATAPKDFVLDYRFPGFSNEKRHANIWVMTSPPETLEAMERFKDPQSFAKMFKTFNFNLDQTYNISTQDNYNLTVYRGVQRVDNINYKRWISMIYTDDAAYQITIVMPEDDNFNDAMAQDFFRSIRLDQNVTVEERLAILPFSFDIVEPFQYSGTSTNRAVMLITFQVSKERPGFPYIVLTKGLENVQGQSLEQILQDYLVSLKDEIKSIKNQKITTGEIANLPAIKLEAQIILGDEDSDVIIFATITKDGYPFYMHVTNPDNSLKNYADVIDKIAKSIKMRD